MPVPLDDVGHVVRGVDRHDDGVAVDVGGDQAHQGQQGLGVGEDPPLVVDQGQALAAGIDDRTQLGAGRGHQGPGLGRAPCSRSKAMAPWVEA